VLAQRPARVSGALVGLVAGEVIQGGGSERDDARLGCARGLSGDRVGGHGDESLIHANHIAAALAPRRRVRGVVVMHGLHLDHLGSPSPEGGPSGTRRRFTGRTTGPDLRSLPQTRASEGDPRVDRMDDEPTRRHSARLLDVGTAFAGRALREAVLGRVSTPGTRSSGGSSPTSTWCRAGSAPARTRTRERWHTNRSLASGRPCLCARRARRCSTTTR
jgi:hypothetical protein